MGVSISLTANFDMRDIFTGVDFERSNTDDYRTSIQYWYTTDFVRLSLRGENFTYTTSPESNSNVGSPVDGSLTQITYSLTGKGEINIISMLMPIQAFRGFVTFNDGADQFDASGFYTTLLSGGDTIAGSDGSEYLMGFAGGDNIYGMAGDDIIDGAEGDDVLNAHGGHDVIYGGAGGDAIAAGDGDDDIYGGLGSDYIFAGAGNDRIFDDAIDGPLSEAGDIDGGAGFDTLTFSQPIQSITTSFGSVLWKPGDASIKPHPFGGELRVQVAGASSPVWVSGVEMINGVPLEGVATVSVSDAASVTEPATLESNFAHFIVSLSAPLTYDLSFAYSTEAGTATSNSDFATTTGTAMISAGNTQITISVPILPDPETEGDESFTLKVSGVTVAGGPAPVLIRDSGTALIKDRPLDPEYNASVTLVGPSSVAEGGSMSQTSAVYHIVLSTPAVTQVTVPFSTFSGNTGGASDFKATMGSLTFAPGEAEKAFSVPITGDATPEYNETFIVGIGTPLISSGTVSILNPYINTLIIDDDRVSYKADFDGNGSRDKFFGTLEELLAKTDGSYDNLKDVYSREAELREQIEISKDAQFATVGIFGVKIVKDAADLVAGALLEGVKNINLLLKFSYDAAKFASDVFSYYNNINDPNASVADKLYHTTVYSIKLSGKLLGDLNVFMKTVGESVSFYDKIISLEKTLKSYTDESLGLIDQLDKQRSELLGLYDREESLEHAIESTYEFLNSFGPHPTLGQLTVDGMFM